MAKSLAEARLDRAAEHRLLRGCHELIDWPTWNSAPEASRAGRQQYLDHSYYAVGYFVAWRFGGPVTPAIRSAADPVAKPECGASRQFVQCDGVARRFWPDGGRTPGRNMGAAAEWFV